MKKLPDNSVDLIFADPPYYLQLPKGKRLKRADGSEIIPVDNDWDSFESYEDYDNFTHSWISECQRILKPTGTFWVIGMYHNIFRVGTIMQNLGLWFLNDVISVLSQYNYNSINWLSTLASAGSRSYSASTCNRGCFSKRVTLRICKIV